MRDEIKKALTLILADLEDNNDHTTGRLLEFAYGLHPEAQDETLYRARLLAQHFIYDYMENLECACSGCLESKIYARGYCEECYNQDCETEERH